MTELREFQDNEVIAGTRYRVLRLIGVGGMGSVYEVEHIELGKRFVLKALLRELVQREDLAQRLRNEWRALARLQHPNIVNVTDAGTSQNGVPFYVMERLEGLTLAALLRQKRRLYVLEAVNIAAAVLDALSAAHDIGIIHRDVKPANVFVVQGGGVKLLDFGIAKIADANSVVTARGLAVGTPRYMSPEQARGERVDGRSDVYAAALILFEMIAGAGPFDDARDANELLLAHLAREAPALSSLVAGVSPDVEQILKRMLAKDCRKRPARARDCAAELRHFAARQHTAPATDSLTARANYGAPTVAALTPPAATRGHDPTTRLEGVARRSLAAPTPTDAALTKRMFLSGESTEVTLSANSSEAHSLSGIPNTTFVAAPPFEVGSTLEMSVGRSSESPHAISRHTLPLPSFPGVERPEQTEMLGEFTPAPPSDAAPTNTRVPLPEVAPPISLTPPPVVDTAKNRVSTAGQASRLTLWAALAAASLSAVLLAGFVARQTVRASDSFKAQAAAPGTLPAAAALLLAPNPSPVPSSAAAPGLPAAPTPASASTPSPAPASAPATASASASAPAPAPTTASPRTLALAPASTLGSAPASVPGLASNRVNVASIFTSRVRAATPPVLARGPLLRAAAAARPVAPPARRDSPPMPSSGL